MRHSQQLSLGSMCAAALVLCVLLSGCGATSISRGGQATVTDTPTSPATVTPYPTVDIPTATTPLSSLESAGCPPFNPGSYTPSAPQYASVGALKVTAPVITNTSYPSELLPGSAPSAPYQIPASAVNTYIPHPLVNPRLSPTSGYELQICNQTSASHTLTRLSVNIASFTPSSGPVNVWHICEDGPYDAATKQASGGCGGGIGGLEFLAATLPSDRTGASAPATAVNGPNLPLTLGPNESLALLISVNGLTSQGTYALSFSFSVDGAAPTTLTAGDGPILMAPSAVVWTGTACQTPAMQAHIPATSQDTYYVCPPTA